MIDHAVIPYRHTPGQLDPSYGHRTHSHEREYVNMRMSGRADPTQLPFGAAGGRLGGGVRHSPKLADTSLHKTALTDISRQ